MSYEGPAGQPAVPPAPPAPPTPPAPGVSPNRNVMIVLSYLWLLALVPLLSEKGDKEVQWHARNGLALFGAEFIVWLALHFIFRAVLYATAGFGCILALFFPILWLAFLVLNVVCIIKGVNGQRLVIPVISSFAEKL